MSFWKPYIERYPTLQQPVFLICVNVANNDWSNHQHYTVELPSESDSVFFLFNSNLSLRAQPTSGILDQQVPTKTALILRSGDGEAWHLKDWTEIDLGDVEKTYSWVFSIGK